MIDLNLNKIDFVYDRLHMDFNDDELMSIWNELDSTRKGDKQIHKYVELNYLLRNDSPTDIVKLTHHDNFDSNHNFIYFANDGRLCTAFILDNIPFFNHEDIAKYLINSKSNKLKVYENEMRDCFLKEAFLSDRDEAASILDNLIIFGMVNMINSDWNKIHGLIQKLSK
jgi:hypothetical protein